MTEADRRSLLRIARAHGLTPRLLSEASAALARIREREGENIDEWADRLAASSVALGETEYASTSPEELAKALRQVRAKPASSADVSC